MNRYKVHIESDYSDAVPLFSSFLLLSEGSRTGATGASETDVGERLEAVSEGVAASMQDPCYICDQDEEPLTVLLEITEKDTSTTIEYNSICPQCLAELQKEIIPILDIEAFQDRVQRLEQAVSQINYQ
jgi:hypothetical protein